MRLFIAIDIPQAFKRTISAAIEPLKHCGLNATWVAQENIHMTVKFLGETHREMLDDIKEAMSAVSARHTSLNAQLTGFGFFPDNRRPRVFYIGTNHEIVLRSIAYEIEENFEELGFAKENRFRAHLTLARFKSPDNLPRLLEKLKNIRVAGTIPIAALTLFKSTLKPSGPVYETLYTAPFKS